MSVLKLFYPSDLDYMQCTVGRMMDSLHNYPVIWFEFDPINSQVDEVYNETITAWKDGVDLKGSVIISPDVEALTRYGVRETGLSNNTYKKPDAIVEFSNHYLNENSVTITNRDEMEIRSNRYAIIAEHRPIGLGGTELKQILYLIEKE